MVILECTEDKVQNIPQHFTVVPFKKVLCKTNQPFTSCITIFCNYTDLRFEHKIAAKNSKLESQFSNGKNDVSAPILRMSW